MSAPIIPLRSDDLPLDCVPTTTRRGTSGCLSSPAALPSSPDEKMPSRVLASLNTSALPRPRIFPSSATPPPPSADVLMRLAITDDAVDVRCDAASQMARPPTLATVEATAAAFSRRWLLRLLPPSPAAAAWSLPTARSASALAVGARLLDMMYFSAQRGKQQQADGSLRSWLMMSDTTGVEKRTSHLVTVVSHTHTSNKVLPQVSVTRASWTEATRAAARQAASLVRRGHRATPPMSDPSHQQFVLKERARQQQQAKQLEQREKALAARAEQTRQQQKVLEDNLAAKEKQLQLTAGNLRTANAELARTKAEVERQRAEAAAASARAAELERGHAGRRAPTARRPSQRARRPSRRCSSWRRPTSGSTSTWSRSPRYGKQTEETAAQAATRIAELEKHAVTFESLLSGVDAGAGGRGGAGRAAGGGAGGRGGAAPRLQPGRRAPRGALRCRHVRAGRHGGAAGRHAGQPRP